MSKKASSTTYWVLLIIFVLAMLADSYGGITQQPQGKDAMRHLGFPNYALSIFGIAKLLGAFAVLQNKFKTIKEWAFAGFVINSIGAAMCHYFVGDKPLITAAPLILLAYIMVLYYFWKKHGVAN